MIAFGGLEEIVREREPLAGHTWFRVGGPAEYFAEPRNQDELAQLVTRCRDEGMPVRLLGGGSNLLVSDDGVAGMVIRLTSGDFDKISVDGEKVTAGGAAKLGHVISTSVAAGLAGLECLVGIPGTIGGALHGNAGGHGGDVGQWADSATVLTRAGELLTRSRDEMNFAYRASSLDELAIVSAEFRLERDEPDELTRRMQKQWITKKASQPMAHQSAGCIFKNPRGMSSGMLIDQAGLKGRRVGGAEVSDRHANFIVAAAGTTAADIRKLIDEVKDEVSTRLGVELEEEIEIW